jgi:hypothetical protein
MRAHIIKDGKVINTIEVEDLDFMPNLVDATLGGAIGDDYIDGQFITPPIPVIVPQTVTRFQALAALDHFGHLDNVEAMMADVSTPRLTKLAYQNALSFERSSALLQSMAGALGLTDEQVDELFIYAEGVTV